MTQPPQDPGPTTKHHAGNVGLVVLHLVPLHTGLANRVVLVSSVALIHGDLPVSGGLLERSASRTLH